MCHLISPIGAVLPQNPMGRKMKGSAVAKESSASTVPQLLAETWFDPYKPRGARWGLGAESLASVFLRTEPQGLVLGSTICFIWPQSMNL